MVGVRVMRGRFLGATTFGLRGSRLNCCMRWDRGTPVSPAMKAPSSTQAPETTAEKRLPAASTAFTAVGAPVAPVGGAGTPGPRGGGPPPPRPPGPAGGGRPLRSVHVLRGAAGDAGS